MLYIQLPWQLCFPAMFANCITEIDSALTCKMQQNAGFDNIEPLSLATPQMNLESESINHPTGPARSVIMQNSARYMQN